MHDEVSSAMLDHPAHAVNTEAVKSRNWLKYRAEQVTFSHFKQVMHTNPFQP